MVNQVNSTNYTLTYTTLSPPLQVRPGEVISYGSLLPGLSATSNTPTVAPVDSLTRITVTGTLTGDGGGYQAGAVSFRPILTNTGTHTVYAGTAMLAALVGGAFSIPLPATDDAATSIPGFAYLVTEPSGNAYQVKIPAASAGGTLDLSVAPRVGAAFSGSATDVVTGTLADAVIPSGIARLSQLTQSRQLGLTRWDDFNRPDGRLDASNGGKLPSGQAWNFSYASPATGADLQIVGGRLRLLAAGASYMWTTGSLAPSGSTVEFSFDPGDNLGGPGVALIHSQQVGPSGTAGLTGVATNAVHCTWTYGTWGIGIFRNDGTGLQIFGNGTWTPPADNTVRCRGSVRLVGPDRVEVTSPDGTRTICRDRRIPQYWGPTVLIEHFQPTANYSTNARPIILGHAVHHPTTRHMPLDPPVGGAVVGGLPGCVPFTSGTLAYIAGVTKYLPVEVTDPVIVNAAYAEVTAAAAAGETMRLAICEADQNWQPTRTLLDLGTKPIDTAAVQSWTGISVPLARGRYLLSQKVSAACTLRYFGYSTPGAGGIRASLLSASPFVQALQVAEAYGPYTDPPTAWNTAAAAGNSGWIAPAALTWTGA